MKGKNIIQYSPEASLIICQVLITLSCYLVFIRKSQDWLFTTLSVSASLAFINLTLLHYLVRSGKSDAGKGKVQGPGFAWSVAFILLGVTGVSVMPHALLMHSPFGAALMILSFGAGWGLFCIKALLITSRWQGPSRPVAGKFRAWHLGILLYIAIGIASWFLASWNPSLSHLKIKGEVVSVKGMSNISPGDPCIADIGWYRNSSGKLKCRSLFSCGGKHLFGSIGMGVFSCSVTGSFDKTVIKGSDNDINDGDPAFSIDTVKRVISYSAKTSGKGIARLKARIGDR